MASPEACSSPSRVKYIAWARLNLPWALARSVTVSSAALPSAAGCCFCSRVRLARKCSSPSGSAAAEASAAWPAGARSSLKVERSIPGHYNWLNRSKWQRWFMWRQRTGFMWLGVMSAVAALLVAACGGSPSGPSAPPAPHGLSSDAGAASANSDDAWTVLSQSKRVATPDSASEPTVAPSGPALMSPDQARSAAPFAYSVPAWAPPGFQLQPQVEVIAPPDSNGFASVSLSWQNPAGARIELSISQDAPGLGLSGAGTDREPVQIGSQLGSLWRQTGFAADRL